LKLIDILNAPFPTNKGYRLIDIQKITKKGNIFKLLLTFQEVERARELYNSKDVNVKRKLNKFSFGTTILKECNIAYARLFVIGSIWWNEGNPMAITPDYLGQFSFDSSIIKNSNLIQCDTSYFSDEQSIPIHFKDKEGKHLVRYPKILCYELKESLYHHKKKEGVIPFYSHVPPWDPVETKFIAFHSYEIYRYFFTSSCITDLNDRLLNQQFKRDSKENSLYDPIESRLKNDNYYIYLRNEYDLPDSVLLGNIAHNKSFKEQIRKIQNYLNISSNFSFVGIDKLPVEKFNRMTTSALRVKRKSDGTEGVFILRIHTCPNYIDHGYTPVVPFSDNKNTNYCSGTKGSSGTRSGGTEVEPRVNNNRTTGMGANTVDIDMLGLDGLLAPNLDIELEETEFVPVDNTGGLVIYQAPDENEISPPGAYSDNLLGGRPKKRIYIDPTDYFDFFPEIVKNICLTLEKNGLKVKLTYLNESLIYDLSPIKIQCKKLKFLENTVLKLDWIMYLVQIEIDTLGSGVNQFFYLFEKTAPESSAGRTWLYSSDRFNKFKEENLHNRIEKYLTENTKSNPDRTEPDNKFNHLQSEKITNNGIEKIKQADALKNHVQKISNRILKVYKK
jgi:hypothetical protein